MKLNLRNSSAVREATYANSTLTVTLQSGRTYAYQSVPSSVVEEFVNAPSVGKFYSQQIRKYSSSEL